MKTMYELLYEAKECMEANDIQKPYTVRLTKCQYDNLTETQKERLGFKYKVED